jgi:hypothetical protein
MPINNFNIGRDCQLVLIGPAGRVDLSYVTGFESRQITHSIRVDKLDGTQISAELPRGWEGTFELERGTSAVDDFIAAAEQSYFNGDGVPFGTVPSVPMRMMQFTPGSLHSMARKDYPDDAHAPQADRRTRR